MRPCQITIFVSLFQGFFVALLKTGRLLRLFRIARRVSRYIEHTAALLGLLMISFALLGHWFACMWYVIGYEELRRNEKNGWLYGLGMNYLRSAYMGKVIPLSRAEHFAEILF